MNIPALPTSSSAADASAVGDFVALLARASDTDSGAVAVLRRVEQMLGGDRVVVELHDPSGSRQVWTSDGVGPVRRLPNSAPTAFDLVAGGTPLGLLTVYRSTALQADECRALGVVADLLAIAVSRDARARALEGVISARVRQIAEQRAFLECVVDSMPVGLYVVDRQYRIQAWNHTRETGSTGVARTEAIGRTIFDVLHRQPAELLKREFDQVFASGVLQQFQMDSSAFGEPRSYRISKIPMRISGDEVSHVITIGEDVTDWKAAIDRTAQAEKLAALGQLAAGVMHEINNPLATIAACAESLVGQLGAQASAATEGASSAELLRIIDLEVQRCSRIVSGLLDFSRPKSARRSAVNLNAVVDHALALVAHHPRARRVILHAEYDRSASLVVDGDVDQLAQVLIALVMNAMDVTPDGQRIVIRTHAITLDDGGSMAAFDVTDQGPGVPRGLQAKIFEPFFTTKPPGHGTGLGLSISYGIVTDHGGTLVVLPAEATGASFRVTLPMAARLERSAAGTDAVRASGVA